MTGGWLSITWDDWQGIYADNPDCDCDLVGRRDQAGAKKVSAGCEFLKCAVGRCHYWRWVDPDKQILGDNKTTEESTNLRFEIKKE